jgi:hypothetical protein
VTPAQREHKRARDRERRAEYAAARSASPRPPAPHPVALADATAAHQALRGQVKQLVVELQTARKRQEFIEAAASAPNAVPPVILPRERKSGLREMTAVAMLSDWHVEEPVRAEQVNGLNEYNLEVADTRIGRVFDGIAWSIGHHRASDHLSIQNLVLSLGGDFISGYIHVDLVENNLLSPTEAVVWLMPRLETGIKSLLDTVDDIVIPCSIGNHGRTTDKTRIQGAAANSYEYLMYAMLKERFKAEKRVRFEITESPHQYVQVYDFLLHFHHGDSVRGGSGIGGLAPPLMRALSRWDQMTRADYHHIGHFHTLCDFGKLMVNGSLIGYGPFSQWIGASAEPPQQMFYLLDKNRGKCQVSPIWAAE